MQTRTPSGSAIHISSSPHGSHFGSAGSARHARRAPVAPRPARAPAATTPWSGLAARQRGPTAPGTRHPGRPSPGPAHRRTRGRSPAPARRGRTSGCAPGRLGAAARGCSTRPWPHDRPAEAPGAQRLLQAEGARNRLPRCNRGLGNVEPRRMASGPRVPLPLCRAAGPRGRPHPVAALGETMDACLLTASGRAAPWRLARRARLRRRPRTTAGRLRAGARPGGRGRTRGCRWPGQG
jgi:hypothetical protein